MTPREVSIYFFRTRIPSETKGIAYFVNINFKLAIMQFCALALCFLVALIPHIAAESTVQLPPGPLYLPDNSTGAAVVTSTGFTRIYYLAADNSIHELRGSGVPRPGVTYLDSLRIPASKVRTDSPLAAVELNRDIEDVRIQSGIRLNRSAHVFSVDQVILYWPRQFSQRVQHTKFGRWRA